MSMAAGEYVSVHSQSDTEKADLSRERLERTRKFGKTTQAAAPSGA
jgi:VIT1/CCC1 family predicted Fe2+/Mn2+ transporter